MTARTEHDADPQVDGEVAGRRGGRVAVVIGAVLVGSGVLLAGVLKARCGLPAGIEEQYLQLCYSDIGPLWFAEGLDRGAAPYLEHPVEYPVLTGLWMWLAAWPANGLTSFFWWTVAGLTAAGAATGALLGAETGRRGVLVVGLAPTLWLSGALNWDLPAMALATAALVAHRRERDGLAGIAVGLGASAKLWPVLLLPGIALAAWRGRGRPAAAAAVGGALAAWAATNLPVLASAPTGWLRFYEQSRERVADWDSLWRVVGQRLGLDPPVDVLNLLVAVLTAAGVVALVRWTVREDPPSRWHLVALPVVAWFLLVGKVWSPQFSLWLLPLLALARPRVVELVAFALADVAVSVTRFPFIGGAAGLEEPLPAWPFDTAVVVRAVVVAVVAITAWRRAAVAGSVGPPDDPPPRTTA